MQYVNTWSSAKVVILRRLGLITNQELPALTDIVCIFDTTTTILFHMMSRQSYDQKNNRQINREETKAQDDLLFVHDAFSLATSPGPSNTSAPAAIAVTTPTISTVCS
jgi:Golgi nucleoside diphosphatase